MKLEKLIAKGTNNEVYKSGDMAVKVFGENYKDLFRKLKNIKKNGEIRPDYICNPQNFMQNIQVIFTKK